jgi:hypothetical protein
MGSLGATLGGGLLAGSLLANGLLAVRFLGGGNGGLEGLGALGEGGFNSHVPGGGFSGNSAGHGYIFVYRKMSLNLVVV